MVVIGQYVAAVFDDVMPDYVTVGDGKNYSSNITNVSLLPSLRQQQQQQQLLLLLLQSNGVIGSINPAGCHRFLLWGSRSKSNVNNIDSLLLFIITHISTKLRVHQLLFFNSARTDRQTDRQTPLQTMPVSRIIAGSQVTIYHSIVTYLDVILMSVSHKYSTAQNCLTLKSLAQSLLSLHGYWSAKVFRR